jgi:Cu/Ag efflux pump CusA
MTSLAFIFGVLPLTIAAGAGAEMRQSLGIAVFAGMIGVTLFGLLFTPAFYVAVRARPAHALAALGVMRKRGGDLGASDKRTRLG